MAALTNPIRDLASTYNKVLENIESMPTDFSKSQLNDRIGKIITPCFEIHVLGTKDNANLLEHLVVLNSIVDRFKSSDSRSTEGIKAKIKAMAKMLENLAHAGGPVKERIRPESTFRPDGVVSTENLKMVTASSPAAPPAPKLDEAALEKARLEKAAVEAAQEKERFVREKLGEIPKHPTLVSDVLLGKFITNTMNLKTALFEFSSSISYNAISSPSFHLGDERGLPTKAHIRDRLVNFQREVRTFLNDPYLREINSTIPGLKLHLETLQKQLGSISTYPNYRSSFSYPEYSVALKYLWDVLYSFEPITDDSRIGSRRVPVVDQMKLAMRRLEVTLYYDIQQCKNKEELTNIYLGLERIEKELGRISSDFLDGKFTSNTIHSQYFGPLKPNNMTCSPDWDAQKSSFPLLSKASYLWLSPEDAEKREILLTIILFQLEHWTKDKLLNFLKQEGPAYVSLRECFERMLARVNINKEYIKTRDAEIRRGIPPRDLPAMLTVSAAAAPMAPPASSVPPAGVTARPSSLEEKRQ